MGLTLIVSVLVLEDFEVAPSAKVNTHELAVLVRAEQQTDVIYIAAATAFFYIS